MVEIGLLLLSIVLRGEPAPGPAEDLPPLPALRDPPASTDAMVHYVFVDTREKLFRWREKVAGVLRLRRERERELARLGERIGALAGSAAALPPLLSDPSRKDALLARIERLRGELAEATRTFGPRFEKADRLIEERLAMEADLGRLARTLQSPAKNPEEARYAVRSIRQRLDDLVERIEPAGYQLGRGTAIPGIELEAGRIEPEIAVHAKALEREKAIEAELDSHARAIGEVFEGFSVEVLRFEWDPRQADPLLVVVLRDPEARVDDDRETRGFRGEAVLRIPEVLDRIFRPEGLTQRARILFEIPVWDGEYGRVVWRPAYGSTGRPIERAEFRRFGDVPREEMLRRLGVAIPPRESIPAPPVPPAVEPRLHDLRGKLAAIFRDVGAELEGVEVREGVLRISVRDPESDADPSSGESIPPRMACFDRCVEAMRAIFEGDDPFRSAQFTILGRKIDRPYFQVVDDPYASVAIDRREFLKYNWPVIDAQEGGRARALRRLGFRLPPPPKRPEPRGSAWPVAIVGLAIAGALGLYLWKRRQESHGP